MTLLIVEDNNRVRWLIKSLVADLADGIVECRDGAEARAAYAAHQPDWVLMDVKMKVTSGITATREIIAAWPRARIVMVTNCDDAETRAAAASAGARAFVCKENLLALRQVLRPGDSTPSSTGSAEEVMLS